MMTKIPEVLKSGSGKRWVWITGVVAIFALLFAIAWNIECERAVAPQELPGEARSFIAQHYPEENPVLRSTNLQLRIKSFSPTVPK